MHRTTLSCSGSTSPPSLLPGIPLCVTAFPPRAGESLYCSLDSRAGVNDVAHFTTLRAYPARITSLARIPFALRKGQMT